MNSDNRLLNACHVVSIQESFQESFFYSEGVLIEEIRCQHIIGKLLPIPCGHTILIIACQVQNFASFLSFHCSEYEFFSISARIIYFFTLNLIHACVFPSVMIFFS